jgi:integrase
LEEYYAIYHHQSTEPWLKNAMDLGLQTLQRRKDIVNMKFQDIKDGYLYVIQSKTEKHGEAAYLKIKIDDPLKKVVDRCRDNTLSPYLIHRKPDRESQQNYKAKGKKHYTQITADYLTKAFAATRDELEIFKKTPIENRPTFHEIRSLGIKLYEDQGIDAQALAGHKTRAMTDKYKEGHGTQWTEVSAGLKINSSDY